MSTGIQLFKSERFGEVRVVEIEGKPYFVGSDIAKSLGYSDPNGAISKHCRYPLKWRISDNHGVPHDYVCVPEGDIYRLAAKSQLPGADEFESWIFDEVLPSIRKHGGYLTPVKTEELMLNPDLIIQMATALKDERAKRTEAEKQIEAQRPKVIFADSVEVSKTSILIGELSKILKQNGIETGQNRLFEWMRQSGYLISRNGTDYNMPTQRSMELGLFEIKETSITHSDGHTTISKTVKVTGKGQIYFVNTFLTKKAA